MPLPTHDVQACKIPMIHTHLSYSIDYVMEIMWHEEAQLEQSASVHATTAQMKGPSSLTRCGWCSAAFRSSAQVWQCCLLAPVGLARAPWLGCPPGHHNSAEHRQHPPHAAQLCSRGPEPTAVGLHLPGEDPHWVWVAAQVLCHDVAVLSGETCHWVWQV